MPCGIGYLTSTRYSPCHVALVIKLLWLPLGEVSFLLACGLCCAERETVCTAVGEGVMWLRRLMPRDINYMTSSASCWWGLLRVVSVVVYCERWDVQRWRDDVASASYSPCLLSCTVRGLFYY